MELYTLGYKVSQLLEETGDTIKKIDLKDESLCEQLTTLFKHAKGGDRKRAMMEGRIPLVAKLLIIELGPDEVPKDLILFDERNTPDQKNKVSIPGGHVEDIDLELASNFGKFYNVLHATIFREMHEEMAGEDSFDDIQQYIFKDRYRGFAIDILPGLLRTYGGLICSHMQGEPNIYYLFTRDYEDQLGVPFLNFYVPIYVYGEEWMIDHNVTMERSALWYRSHYFIKYSKYDHDFITHASKANSGKTSSLMMYEYGRPADDDIRFESDDDPKSRILPAIFNTKDIWNPIN